MIRAKAFETACRKDQNETTVWKAPLVFEYNFSVLCALMEYDILDREILGQHNLLSEVIQLNIMANNFILK